MHHESRRSLFGFALLLGALALGACERELPTEVGGEQVPEASLRTYEILLRGPEFLAGDTLLRGFGSAVVAPLLIVAENYLDTLDAHALIRFGDFPQTVTYADSGNATTTDSIAAYLGGRIVLRVDTTSLGLDTLGTDTAITFEVYELAEGFDARTTTWTAREALPGDTTFWTTPGGTVGDLIGSATWSRNTPLAGDTTPSDSVVFLVDSATVTAWAEGNPDTRAILIRTTTAGARAQVAVPRLSLTVRGEMDDDTTERALSAVIVAQTYIIDPPPPAPTDELRVGDRTAWRSFLVFREGLDTLTVQCPGEPGCSFRLADASVNRAQLRLTTLAVPAPWRIRSNLTIEARPVLGDASRPLERAPLSDTTGVAGGIQPGDFASDGDSMVTIGVTRMVRGLLASSTDSTLTERNRTLAILSSPEPLQYGIARFGALGTEQEPVLRLIVTVPVREEED